jgi:hypothetical protein
MMSRHAVPAVPAALQGVLTTLAIGVHNIPEGLAKATVLVGQGVTPRRALLWSVATCLPQPLVAVPSFIFVEAFKVGGYLWEGMEVGCGETPAIQLCRRLRSVSSAQHGTSHLPSASQQACIRDPAHLLPPLAQCPAADDPARGAGLCRGVHDLDGVCGAAS